MWRAVDSRTAAYHSLFAGAAGYTYGHVSVWDFYAKAEEAEVIPFYAELFGDRQDWTEALDAPGAGQMRHAKALMLSRPYFTRMPDNTVVIGDPGRGGAHISATRDADGSFAMIYIPQGQVVEVDLTKLSGREKGAWWFDPREGVGRRVPSRLNDLDRARFEPPTQGLDQDWVLVLDDESRSYPEPGTARR